MRTSSKIKAITVFALFTALFVLASVGSLIAGAEVGGSNGATVKEIEASFNIMGKPDSAWLENFKTNMLTGLTQYNYTSDMLEASFSLETVEKNGEAVDTVVWKDYRSGAYHFNIYDFEGLESYRLEKSEGTKYGYDYTKVSYYDVYDISGYESVTLNFYCDTTSEELAAIGRDGYTMQVGFYSPDTLDEYGGKLSYYCDYYTFKAEDVLNGEDGWQSVTIPFSEFAKTRNVDWTMITHFTLTAKGWGNMIGNGTTSGDNNVDGTVIKVQSVMLNKTFTVNITEPDENCDHGYDSVRTVPVTCTNVGYSVKVCSKCGGEVVDPDSYVMPVGHIESTADGYAPEVVAPTCCSEGYTIRSCGVCGENYKTDVTKTIGHTWGNSEYYVPATCEKYGYTYFTCVYCGAGREVVNKDDPKLGHSYVSVVTAPTCTEEGYTTYTCSRCGVVNVSGTVPALGHAYDGGLDAECNACGYIREIPDAIATGYCGGEGDGTNLTWRLDEEGTLTVFGTGAMRDISFGWLKYKDLIKEVFISDGVTSIGAMAFEDCSSLMSVIIPDSVTSIGVYAFYGCSSLVSVIIPDSVTSIGEYAFSGCRSLRSVEIPDSVTSIGDYAFHYCSSLTSVEIGDSVTSIGDHAFEDCFNLTSVVIPDSVTSIGYAVFNRCSKLTKVTFCAAYGWWVSSSSSATSGTTLSSADLSNTLTAATYLTSKYCGYYWYRDSHVHEYTSVVTAPTCTEKGFTTYTCSCGDTYVGDYVDALGHNYVSLVTAPTCTEKGFTTYICIACRYGYNGDYTDMIPHEYGEDGCCRNCGCKEVIAEGLFAWQLTNDGTLTVTGKGAMPNYTVDEVPWADYKSRIVRIEIGEGITTVGRCAFYGCEALREVTLPSTLTAIGEYGFYGCKSLTEITIPASVTAIGKFAFRRAGLVKISFEIGYGWYAGEVKLSATELYSLGAGALTKTYYKYDWTRDVNAEVEEVNPNFVDGGTCNSYTRWELVYIDEAKTKMKLMISGNGAMPDYSTGGAPWYEYAASIVEIEVAEGVTTVGRCAFYGLKAVTEVTLCDGIVKIGDHAFNGCRALTEIDIPDSVASIGTGAFAKTGLKDIPTV